MRIYKKIHQFLYPPIPQADAQSEALIQQINLGKDDIAIDCGANVGSITGIIAKTGATVYSFEPNPFAFKQLRRTFLLYPNVHCLPYAVSDSESSIQLYLHENSDESPVKWSVASSIFAEKTNVNTSANVEVKSIDLAQFIRSLKRPIRIIKMDIEGAEYQTLQHLIKTDTIALVDQIYVETHHDKNPFFLKDYEALQELIKKHHITNINTDWI